jgi:two-component system, OmpR family, alkaline phosphatase synthesis response regulator PhoP
MSKIEGNEIIKELRKINKEVTIIVTSSRNKEEDIVYSLNLGADDYIIKPISQLELIARVRAHLRKINIIKGNMVANTDALVGYEPIAIKIGNSTIFFDKMVLKRNNDEYQLTPKELGMIRLLYKNRGNVVSREMMMKEIWGDGVYVTERVIDTNVVSIRKKIGDTGRKPKYIKTVFGVGYKLIES